MAFFDNFKEKAKDLANTGVAQSKRLAAIAKLKTANMAEEDTMKRAYIELGKVYFAEHGTEAGGVMAPVCEKILAAQAAIEVNNERIAELNGKADEDFTEGDIVAEAEVVDVATVEDEEETAQ